MFIDCRALRRLDFTAAGQLLNVVAGLRAAGRTVEFDGPNHLVAALLAVFYRYARDLLAREGAPASADLAAFMKRAALAGMGR